MLTTLLYFIVILLIFALQRAIFIMVNLQGVGFYNFFQTLWHGIPMDCSVAGYLCIFPLIISSVALFFKERKPWVVALKIYSSIIALLLSIILISDLSLYPYWGFRLDMTPVFYLATSPSAAFASVSLGILIAGITAILLLALIIRIALAKVINITLANLQPIRINHLGVVVVSLFILQGGLLFLAIRGGVTVSTMHPGRAYYSDRTDLNHAAVNPAFSLLYSATHQEKFDTMYSFFSDSESELLVESLQKIHSVPTDTVTLVDSRPDIYIIILESFSSHLFPALGGEDIAVKLDSIAQSGILFTDFYSSGFRTDRGIPAIISGWPSAPTASIMKYMKKAEQLPGIATELNRQAGYQSFYYYGGDADFTNMRAYLISAGFKKIISDEDFPISRRLSKWGVHDDVLFSRLLDDISSGKDFNTPDNRPILTVIQTSSSHEPFEVPYHNQKHKDNPKANAFAYTDSVVSDFLKRLPMAYQKSHRDNKALVLLVADHWGAYPEREKLTDIFSRHKIPFIITGDALKAEGKRIVTPGSQTDIAATLLSLLKLDHTMFRFSTNLLGTHTPYAWMCDKDEIALITTIGKVSYNIDANSDVISSDSKMLEDINKAYLQNLYRKISRLETK